MLMSPFFPCAILRPGVVTELRRISQLGFGDARTETSDLGIVSERAPRNRIVAVRQSENSAEAHDCISGAARNLLQKKMIDLADDFVVGPNHVRADDVSQLLPRVRVTRTGPTDPATDPASPAQEDHRAHPAP